MISMVFIFIVLTLAIAVIHREWAPSSKEERSSVIKYLSKGAIFASVAFVFLFVIVNVF